MMRVRRGFTLPELSLASVFLAVLLIAVAVVIMNALSIVQKGNAMKNVNDVGQELMKEVTSSIKKSSYSDIYYGGAFNQSVYQQYTKRNTTLSSGTAYVPYFGVFCDGIHSYVWNTGYAIKSSNSTDRATLRLSDGSTLSGFRLVRVDDSTRAVCVNHTSISSNTFRGGSGAVELLEDRNGSLALYDFKVLEPAFDENSGNALYALSFILGTIEGGVDIRSTNGTCKTPPDGSTTDFNYCSVNKFNFVAQSTGGISL